MPRGNLRHVFVEPDPRLRVDGGHRPDRYPGRSCRVHRDETQPGRLLNPIGPAAYLSSGMQVSHRRRTGQTDHQGRQNRGFAAGRGRPGDTDIMSGVQGGSYVIATSAVTTPGTAVAARSTPSFR